MAEPAFEQAGADEIESSVDAAIAICDGDVRAALRAALVYNEFLERKLDEFRTMISAGFTRGRISPARRASEKLDEWREISGDALIQPNSKRAKTEGPTR
jgi:hypothetical protein